MGKGTLRGAGTPPSSEIGPGIAIIGVALVMTVGMVYQAYNNATKDMSAESTQDRMCERMLRKAENQHAHLLHWENAEEATKYMESVKPQIEAVCGKDDEP